MAKKESKKEKLTLSEAIAKIEKESLDTKDKEEVSDDETDYVGGRY